MNIAFIGCPSSGKTTTAAMVFAKLKEAGVPAEFVPEYARLYIARERVGQNLEPHQDVHLCDDDQLNIMFEQHNVCEIMSKACGPDVVVVNDSSALLALLYMSDVQRAALSVQICVEEIVKNTNVFFYAAPIEDPFLFDPNRVHDQKQSLAIDAEIPKVLSRYAPDVKLVPLTGSPELRCAQALQTIYSKLA